MSAEKRVEQRNGSTLNALFLELEALEQLYQTKSGWRLEQASFTEEPCCYEATLVYSKTTGPNLEIHYAADELNVEAIEENLNQKYQTVTHVQTNQFENKAKILQYRVGTQK